MIDVKMTMETSKFNRDMKKYTKNSGISTEKAIRKIAFDLLALILQPPPFSKHPVKLGRARAGWYASVKGLGKSFNFGDGEGVGQGMREGSFKDNTKAPLNKYVELINAVRYILFLEYGASQQAPLGMARISIRAMRGKLPKTINQSFIDEWNKFKWSSL